MLTIVSHSVRKRKGTSMYTGYLKWKVDEIEGLTRTRDCTFTSYTREGCKLKMDEYIEKLKQEYNQ